MDATNAKSNIQKKMLVYARDIALDKLNKKLDKKLAKQIRKKENDGVLYQRCSQNSDCVGTSSELTSSSSDIAPLVHSKEKLAASTSTVEPEKIFFPQQILNKHNGDLDRSISGTDSSGQDEEYQTADEDEEENEELVKKKDVSQTCTVSNVELKLIFNEFKRFHYKEIFHESYKSALSIYSQLIQFMSYQ